MHLDQPAGTPQAQEVLEQAIRAHFARRSEASRRRLRQLFRRGRISLAIGLVCLGASLLAGEAVAGRMEPQPLATVLRESLLIGGWVAMWRPLEIFLYEWWPILDKRRFHDRLSRMAVRIVSPWHRNPEDGSPRVLPASGAVPAREGGA